MGWLHPITRVNCSVRSLVEPSEGGKGHDAAHPDRDRRAEHVSARMAGSDETLNLVVQLFTGGLSLAWDKPPASVIGPVKVLVAGHRSGPFGRSVR
ncbi:MAG: hypothetical protein FD153_1787 [Rhodospirillaceae bacterium]|nr:MAG: hypothetical protein FD153_1787 [Rhodospirillaceae bacterium]